MRDGRRACETPKSNQGIADRATQRRGWSKGHNRISVKMVKHIPYGVKEPADADEVIGLKSAICKVCDDCRNSHFPNPPFRYAAPAPAIMIALKFLRFGSRKKEQAETNRMATNTGAIKSIAPMSGPDCISTSTPNSCLSPFCLDDRLADGVKEHTYRALTALPNLK
jgi:hypothetical protein